MGRAERTASLEAENARLRERLRLLDDAIESMGHGLCVFAPDRRIAVCNRRYAEVLDLAPEEARPGRFLGDMVRKRLENDAYEPGRDAAEIDQRCRSTSAFDHWHGWKQDGADRAFVRVIGDDRPWHQQRHQRDEAGVGNHQMKRQRKDRDRIMAVKP